MLRPISILMTAAMLGAASAVHAWPPLSEEVLDLEARIEYGFYAADARTIEGALERLQQMEGDDAAVRYYEALAAYRLAQVELTTGAQEAQPGAMIDRCASLTQGIAADTAVGAEAAILAGACAVLAAADPQVPTPLSQRKVEQALARARSADADNPRLSLVEARMALARKPIDAAGRTAARERLEAAVRAFEEREGVAGPRWGEAETLAALAELDLADGEIRAARDMIERALLAAPGYRFALSLKERL